MSSNLIQQPYPIILNPHGGGGSAKPAANAEFHVGEIGKDPVQYPRTDIAYKDEETGEERLITSPIYTNNSGAFVASKNSGTIIQPYMKDGAGYSVLIKGRRGTIYESKAVGDPGNLSEIVNAGDSQVLGNNIYPKNPNYNLNVGNVIPDGHFIVRLSLKLYGLVPSPPEGKSVSEIDENRKVITFSDGSKSFMVSVDFEPSDARAWGAVGDYYIAKINPITKAIGGYSEDIVNPNPTDNTEFIQRCANNNNDYFFGEGHFGLSSGLTTSAGKTVSGSNGLAKGFYKTSLIALDGFTGDSIIDYSSAKFSEHKDFNIDCRGLCKFGMYGTGIFNHKGSNIRVENATEAAFEIKGGGATYGNVWYRCMATDSVNGIRINNFGGAINFTTVEECIVYDCSGVGIV